MQKRLTQAVVEKMKADPSRRIEVQDELVSGLRLRISPLGRKSWSLVLSDVSALGANFTKGTFLRPELLHFSVVLHQ